MQLVDNLNVFYVALTRAGKSLHVIAKPVSKKCRESVSKGEPAFGNLSEVLYVFLRGEEEFTAGKPYDFTLLEREENPAQTPFPGQFPSIPLDGRLTPSQEADDFFGDDGRVGPEASPRLRGIVLHDILSEVMRPADLGRAVQTAVRDGRLDAAGGEAALALLGAGIARHPDWFPETPGPDVRVLNERTLFDAGGREFRPDRVILRGREVTVVDFKFGGENPSYRRQVERYAQLWHELGYQVKGAYLWYVPEDKTEPVC